MKLRALTITRGKHDRNGDVLDVAQFLGKPKDDPGTPTKAVIDMVRESATFKRAMRDMARRTTAKKP